MLKRLPEVIFGVFLLAILAVSSCTTAAPVTTRGVVYISDFYLEAAQAHPSGPGNVPKPVPLGQRLGYGRPRIEHTPEQRQRDLVDLMSRSLLDDLHRAGISAQRLPPGAPLPSSGWLIRGAFLGVDAGGRLRPRVEFGAGSMQEVVAAIDQLGGGAPPPLYTIDSTAGREKFPGPVVTPNPNIALGRFVLTRGEVDRNVTAVAEDIANQVKVRMTATTSHISKARYTSVEERPSSARRRFLRAFNSLRISQGVGRQTMLARFT